MSLGSTTYASVTWTNGDTISETKLDNMVANDQAYDSHAAQGVLLNNNVGYYQKDSGAVNRALMNLNASNILELGGAGIASYLLNLNNIALNQKDSGGTARQIAKLDSSNVLHFGDAALAGITFDETLNNEWWEELGRTTLGSDGDSLSVTSFTARKHLRVIARVIQSGSLNIQMTFNNDTGNNYAVNRLNSNVTGTVSGAVAVSQANLQIGQQTLDTNRFFTVDIINEATRAKLCWTQETDEGVTGAGNAPLLRSTVGKWANTSNQITRIDILNNGAGNMLTGSQIIVLGHD